MSFGAKNFLTPYQDLPNYWLKLEFLKNTNLEVKIFLLLCVNRKSSLQRKVISPKSRNTIFMARGCHHMATIKAFREFFRSERFFVKCCKKR